MILLLRDYLVLSKFTLTLLEDSGWYQVDYGALYNLKQLPLQWGKGKSFCMHMHIICMYIYIYH